MKFFKSENLATFNVLTTLALITFWLWVSVVNHLPLTKSNLADILGMFLFMAICVGVPLMVTYLMITGSIYVFNYIKYNRRSPCMCWSINQANFNTGINVTWSIVHVMILLIVVPHVYMVYRLRPIYDEWVKTGNEIVFVKRDTLLKQSGFDYTTGLRHWTQDGGHGIYLPSCYLRVIGVSQKDMK